mmetsp:Transcript_24214/g.28183  ORF Transcript_24214/g.28183 Transcript_24214/m.28183 type:complete len:222 (+) Transcript_24214:47-712(+)|eukprot:CAMPEP_0176433414 /NCGR_PEP_ID=MMETSP0127-20121128/16008_1 /TAXON_ID=938130 /ORGANISM="Platyophrya macrostoma, Strain WH" /LENGTH=221 /DNA_ID=CAMNT_0017815837 /DNA_START=42 /DNA_END=707 /DNA_ORIENTATION=-
MSQYGKAEYWDERYLRDPEPFDWYQRFSGFKDKIASHLATDAKILNVGSGNSRMSEEMFEEGFQYIHNIDISSVVVKSMNEKYRDKGPNFKFLQMDARSMDYEDGAFDIVVDKGTLDSILCGEGSATSASKMLSEINRVLSPKGVYICISYGIPDHRLLYLEKPEFDWKVTRETIPKPTISTSVTISSEDKDSPQVHYIYICKKTGTGISMKDKEERKENF